MPGTDAGGDSFADFVAGSLPALLRFGHVLTGSPQEAEDLVQEALARCLPAWPDAEARIRRAAWRQRLRAAGLAGCAGAVVIAAIAVPLALLAGGHATPVTGIQPGSSPSASPARHAKPHPALTLPAVGAAGFPASIYPPPASHEELNLVGLCPNPAGLQPPGPGIRAAALAVINHLGRSFRSDLRLTDRVYWRQTLTNWREGLGGSSGKAARTLHVLYSGPLQSYHQAFGPPDMSHTIVTGCGSRTARDTWMIVIGRVRNPALQGEYLLLTRQGHVLAWNVQ